MTFKKESGDENKGTCRTCQNEGTFGVPCKECGKEATLVSKEVATKAILHQEDGVHRSVMDALEFDADLLRASKLGMVGNDKMVMEEYLQTLAKLHERVGAGFLLNQSLIICSGSGYGKTISMGDLRCKLAKNGHKVSKLRSVEDFQAKYASFLMGKNIGMVFNDEVIESDILVLRVLNTSNPTLQATMDRLMKYCAAMEKPFVVYATLPINKIVSNISVVGGTGSMFKFPSAIVGPYK